MPPVIENRYNFMDCLIFLETFFQKQRLGSTVPTSLIHLSCDPEYTWKYVVMDVSTHEWDTS